jgi:predicted RNA-binding Zn-ribbon protein involved in translation (DUF1610 family)
MDLLNRFRKFMYGRYGFDALGRFLFILSLVFWALSFIFRFTPLKYAYYVFWGLNLIIYGYALFRIFSKNILARTAENERYLRLRGKFMPGLQRLKAEKLDKDHVFKRCPHCGTRLRLRRVRGKHNTRCPKCGTAFTLRIFFGPK